jgi:uncharacterized lipoprotein YddW (UPF0748 family)
MKHRFSSIVVLLFLCVTVLAQGVSCPKREFRGSWIQCVNGQFQGLGRDAMQKELLRQLDALQKCNVNAVFFQVRAEADALYPSLLEPWSRFLTGTQGLPPSPMWDPLQWMIDQCHNRGMELHAWINPYRAKTSGTTELAASHPYMENPNLFFRYGKLILFNPAYVENREYICEVVSDIVSRYDVDGIHIDDYFYPYPEAGVDIPDAADFAKYGAGFASIGDWRRDNVSRLIQSLHETIKRLKPWVKFGVSPFGIYHNTRSGAEVPGSNTGGLQNYDDLYADVLLWANKGWIDYNIPQLYWEIGHKVADYDTLIRWWSKLASSRPLYIGQDVERTVRAADLKNPSVNQLPEKMRLQRSLPGVSGSCLWYSAAVANNVGNIANALQNQFHKHPALVPQMPFKDNEAPKKIKGTKVIWADNGPVLVWIPRSDNDEMQRAVRYVVYRFKNGEKVNLDNSANIIAVTPNTFLNLPYNGGSQKYTYVVTSLDRMWNESKAKKIKVKL